MTVGLVLKSLTPPIASLPHVAQTVSAFVDYSHQWTLEKATKAGHLLLLDRLAAKQWSGVDYDIREARFLYNVRAAVRRGIPSVLHWWRTKYLPDGPNVAADILRLAACKGHMNVIQWLYDVDGHVRYIGGMQGLWWSHCQRSRTGSMTTAAMPR